MAFDYRKPGVYVEESLLINSADTAAATSVALFVGAAGSGSTSGPIRCNTWSDYVMNFGGFGTIKDPTDATAQVTSYLPYSVYSYFQNGGRPCYVQRAVGSGSGGSGTAATVDVTDGDTESPTVSFTLTARSVGVFGNNLAVNVFDGDTANPSDNVFTIVIYKDGIEIERFQHLTMDGTINGVITPGIRRVDTALNDPYSGSSWVQVSDANISVSPAVVPISTTPTNLDGGVDPHLPGSGDFLTAAVEAVKIIEGPVIVNAVGYDMRVSGTTTYTYPTTAQSSSFSDRGDVFIINDSVAIRQYGQSSSDYASTIKSALGEYSGDSYVAAFAPWIIIPDPQTSGATITVPPGGAVAGVMSRIDSTIGVFRAPAGMVASISNAVGVDAKFSDSDLGDLNSSNINVIRPVQGAGVAIMGARTRKVYGADRYISARRTLIYIKESLRRSTQFALFENNDNRLWTQLIMTAERLLRPLWEAGGLRGASAAEAYYIKCDSTINTPSVVASGEVRMEIGVALEYPAEFIIIHVSQYESGGFAAEVQPLG